MPESQAIKDICRFCMSKINAGSLYCENCDRFIDASDDPKINLELWTTIVSLWDAEANRFWTRNSIFLILNGGLIAYISSGKAHFFRDAFDNFFNYIILINTFGFTFDI